MIEAGVRTVTQGAGVVPPGVVHSKADTAQGLVSLQAIADLGAPYPVLLYEHFLGSPYVTHRNSVSERVGEVVESAIKSVLDEAKISFRETKRAERIPGFDQAPNFIIPDEFTPVALIEAKLAEDDGTARDKVSRVLRLRTLRDEQGKDYDVIACIAGRGFKVRREACGDCSRRRTTPSRVMVRRIRFINVSLAPILLRLRFTAGASGFSNFSQSGEAA